MSICVSLYLSIYVSVYLSFCLSIYLSICKLENCMTSSILDLGNIKNAAILRDVLNFPSWQCWQHSKTKQFCETSFKNGKLSAELTASYQYALRFFQSMSLKVLRLPRKSEARPHEALHLSRKIILANKEDLMLKNAALLRKSAPGPPNMSCSCASCTAPATRNASLQILYKWCPTPATFCSVQNPLLLPHKTRCNVVFSMFTSKRALRAITACTFWTSQLPKVFRHWGVLRILTSKCASHHNDVHFLNISFPKSARDFQMCIAPQWRALFLRKVLRTCGALHFDFEMCFAPERRAFVYLSSGQMAPHPPL